RRRGGGTAAGRRALPRHARRVHGPAVTRSIDLRGVTLVRRTQQEFHYDFKRTALNLLRGRWQRASRRTVLDGVDLGIAHGEKVAIIGPNGSGKSTLLKVVAGILAPTRGTVA